MYELAAGHRPFRGESTPSTMAKILESEPEPLLETRPELPTELDHIVSRLGAEATVHRNVIK